MSTSDVATRLGTTRQAVSQIEHSEVDGSIRLETLAKAAAALECRLVYALVPNTPLEAIVDRRARQVAEAELGPVRQTMLLEDQRVDDAETDHLLAELTEEIKGSRRLWRS
jgi:predicted DNA-binding mobile mystery protein A